MDPELKRLLEENLRVAEETNAMLKSMQRFSRWSLAGKVVLYVLVFIIPLFFLSAYLGPIMSLMNGGTGSSSDFSQILDQYKAQYGQ